MGRKNKYETHVKPKLDQIAKWYQDLTERQIAEKLGIAMSSWERYKNEYPELKEVLLDSSQQLKEELKDTLKKKAKGFYYEEIKTTKREVDGDIVTKTETYRKYAQPDTGAIHLLLKNIDDDWHNDDTTTIDLKRKQLELTERKIENDEW